MDPFNIDASINGAYIAMGLLFGQGDFGKTMEISTRCGQDSDCNPSSAVGVLGVVLGYAAIPDLYKSGIAKIADTKFKFTDYSFNEICQSTEARALKLVQKAGGKVSDSQVEIPAQKAGVPALEQWNPGVPYLRIAATELAWSWQGDWQDKKGVKTTAGKGAEATLKFEGVAVAVIGQLTQEGGQADVFLDGQKAEGLDAFIVKNTHDNALWHVYGLKPGAHTLRIVPTGKADPRSTGTRINIARAVVYR
jgi:hypothetical protein